MLQQSFSFVRKVMAATSTSQSRQLVGPDFVYPARLQAYQARLAEVSLSPIFSTSGFGGPLPPASLVHSVDLSIREELGAPKAGINYEADFNRVGLTAGPVQIGQPSGRPRSELPA